MVAEIASDAQLTVIDTEHPLVTSTLARNFVLRIGGDVMLAGDVIEIRAKVKVRSGGATIGYIVGTFSGAQPADEEALDSIPISSVHEIAFTLKQTAGAVRTFEWSLLGS